MKRYLSLFAAVAAPILISLTLTAFRPTGDQKNVTIVADGQAVNLTTSKNFVGDALSAAGIEYDADDLIMPPAMATIEDGEVITLRRVTRAVFEQDVVAPFETLSLPNARMRAGTEVELRAGSPGLRRETIERETIDGTITAEKVISNTVIMKPISRKIYLGTRTTGSTVSSKRMNATAYTAGAESCAPYSDGVTCVLKVAGYGVAAVDPAVIALGTRLYIEGYGFAVASDIGGDIKGNRIDLFMSDLKTAQSFGRRPVVVHLLD